MHRMMIFAYALALPLMSSGCSHFHGANSERQTMHRIIGEMIVELDHTSSHQDGPDYFGSGPISTTYEKYYFDHVAELPIEDRVAYFLAGFFHFGFTGGDTDALYLELVCADGAAESFLRVLENYVAISEQLERGYTDDARNMILRLNARAKEGRCAIAVD